MNVEEQYKFWENIYPKKTHRNLVLVSDMVADGFVVVLDVKISRWKMARYLFLLGLFKTEWAAYLQVLRYLRFK